MDSKNTPKNFLEKEKGNWHLKIMGKLNLQRKDKKK